MSNTAILLVVSANLCLFFVVFAAPFGVWSFRIARKIDASRSRIWSAVWPLGENTTWSGEIIAAESDPDELSKIVLTLAHEGRDGKPIRRRIAVDDVVEGKRFAMRVVDDTSLDQSFWKNYRTEYHLSGKDGAVTITLRRTDCYRGLAFALFRYFSARRELAKLASWATTGVHHKGGWFERPITQLGLAILSSLMLWPIFGLTSEGLVLASMLTLVIALHEFGHMAAFRLLGHKSARMIFIPLLGGIALGDRPYDSRFEVGFSALMGAGLSSFLVPIVIYSGEFATEKGLYDLAVYPVLFAAFLSFFNLANLLPIWKFDGGQVLRQICPNMVVLAALSFFIFFAFLTLGAYLGVPAGFLFGAGGVALILSFMTAGSGVKPKSNLKPIGRAGRLLLGSGLFATFGLHAIGMTWAIEKLGLV